MEKEDTASNSPDELFRDGSVTLSRAVEEFGIGRTRLYSLMNSGRLQFVQAGARRLIPRVALQRLLADCLVGRDE